MCKQKRKRKVLPHSKWKEKAELTQGVSTNYLLQKEWELCSPRNFPRYELRKSSSSLASPISWNQQQVGTNNKLEPITSKFKVNDWFCCSFLSLNCININLFVSKHVASMDPKCSIPAQNIPMTTGSWRLSSSTLPMLCILPRGTGKRKN